MKVITEKLKFINEYPDRAGETAKRLHVKKDEIPFVRKYYISEKQEADKEKRSVISYISTDIVDRDGERLLPNGVDLKNYRKNPVVMLGHDYKSLPVGKNIWIKNDDKGLLAKTAFAKSERGDEMYRACTEDIGGTGPLLQGWSVGFIPIEWEDIETKGKKEKPERIYKKWELLEYSIVPIPSCPEALTIAIEKGLISKRLKKDLEIEVVKEEEMEFIDSRPIVVEKESNANYAKVEEYTEGMPKEIEVVKGKKIIETLEEAEADFRKAALDGIVEKINKEMTEGLITKPETTENYHRIPVEDPSKHKGHRIRTITISASQGIKALYCGTCKKVITYLFDVKKWTMEEAKKWVLKHKSLDDIETKEPEYRERWNKSLSKVFDVASVEAPIATFNYALYEKFLECKVKDIFLNSYSIPSPLLGTYLAGFKKILSDFKLKDTRNFTWVGGEIPPVHEVIKLNSEKSDDFLIDGIYFYDADGKPLVVKFSLGWDGISISIITSSENKEWNKELLDKVHSWAYENNYLRGEKFALSGEFLDEPGDNWDNLILDAKYKDSIVKSASFLEKKGKELTGRGLLFIGPPGTGKTKTGRVLMNELDMTFIWVSSKDFRNIGPLRALVLGFSLARDLAPSILFLEDIDTWLRGEMEFVTDLIKTEMDGIKQNKGLITIMTSNYPEKLPDALLDRPGRFHHIINFELPGGKQRKEMISLWIGEIEGKLLDDIVKKTKGFSGAHLKELVEFAKMIAEEDETETGDALLKSLDKLIEQRELIEEIKDNQVEAKEFWGKLKYAPISGIIIKNKKIEVEKMQKHDEQVKEYQKECEHEWIDITKKDEKYVKEYTCPKCGLTKEVPIPAVHYDDLGFAIKDLTDQVAELKEGRVLSTKNRTLVKDTIEALATLKEKLDELYGATEPPAKADEKQKFNCECIKCGYKMTSDKHCDTLKCPECGGDMRRAERPGPGKEVVLAVSEKKTDTASRIASLLEETFKGDKITELLKKAVDDAFDIKIKKKLGKVE